MPAVSNPSNVSDDVQVHLNRPSSHPTPSQDDVLYEEDSQDTRGCDSHPKGYDSHPRGYDLHPKGYDLYSDEFAPV